MVLYCLSLNKKSMWFADHSGAGVLLYQATHGQNVTLRKELQNSTSKQKFGAAKQIISTVARARAMGYCTPIPGRRSSVLRRTIIHQAKAQVEIMARNFAKDIETASKV